MRSEKEITKAIRQYLDINQIFHYKHWQGFYSSLNGVSDIIGILDCGRFLAIEVKKEGWKPPKQTNKKAWKHHCDQVDFIDNINFNGGLAFFATSLDDVIKELT